MSIFDRSQSIWTLRSRRDLKLGLKRALDLGVAVWACILLAPLFAVVAIIIKLDLSGPVFFTQTRRGLHFQPFTIVKFQTLHHGAADPHDRYEMI